jgi:hypothetical protein
MADSKDETSQEARSSVDALFHHVDSWGAEALGRDEPRSGRQGGLDDPFQRDKAQRLSGWSLFEAAVGDPASARAPASAPKPESEADSRNIAELYAAHERAHDSAGNDNPFVDPAGLALAVHGAPQLEPVSANTGSLSAVAQLRAASTADKGGPAAVPIATSAGLGIEDAILSHGASLYQGGGGQPEGSRVAAGVWKKLWRY